ncbi:MAG: hypothetical protein KDD44_00600 [Bdellovibrionales bacterium]|nr:hypothetical protein [Bdellovibrionales bacterium]
MLPLTVLLLAFVVSAFDMVALFHYFEGLRGMVDPTGAVAQAASGMNLMFTGHVFAMSCLGFTLLCGGLPNLSRRVAATGLPSFCWYSGLLGSAVLHLGLLALEVFTQGYEDQRGIYSAGRSMLSWAEFGEIVVLLASAALLVLGPPRPLRGSVHVALA